MRTISYRLDDERAQRLEKLFTEYGFSGTATAQHIKLLDMLFALADNRRNSQTVAESTANALAEKDCNLRIKAKQLIRVLGKDDKPAYAEQDVFFCVQWKAGTVKKQLKLITTDVCDICIKLREKWLEEQNKEIADFTEITTPAPQPIALTVPLSQPAPMQPAKVPNTFYCDRQRCDVHYSVCFGCRAKNSGDYYMCLRANPETAKALAYWKALSGKKP